MKLLVHEFGDRDQSFHFIDGFTGDYEPLENSPWGGPITRASQYAVDMAYRRLTRPLVDQLGPDPKGCLRKLPKSGRVCFQRQRCPLHDKKRCHLLADQLPHCFEPEGVEDDGERQAAARAIQVWHEGVYLVAVTHDG